MKKTLGVAAALLAGAAAVVALGLFSLQRLTPDAPPPDDADLRPVLAAADGADDAYPDLAKMTAALTLTPEERALLNKLNESPTPDPIVVEPLIARSGELLRLFAGFSRRARFTDPSYRDPAKAVYEAPVPQFYPVVSAARLGSLRAALLLEQGRAPEALEEALVVVDAGMMLLRSDQPLINPLVGMLVTDIGARRALRVIETGALGKARLLAAARRLSAHRGGAAALQAGIRFEYLGQSQMLDRMPELAFKAPEGRWYHAVAARSLYIYQPERTRALYAARFRSLVTEAAKPCRDAQFVHEPATLDARPNVLGRVFFNMAYPRYDKLYIRRCESDFRVAAAAAGAAVAAYRIDHKRYPSTIEELVPRYLTYVPVDPHTGAALLYSPETGAVHSAGKDVDGKPL